MVEPSGMLPVSGGDFQVLGGFRGAPLQGYLVHGYCDPRWSQIDAVFSVDLQTSIISKGLGLCNHVLFVGRERQP